MIWSVIYLIAIFHNMGKTFISIILPLQERKPNLHKLREAIEEEMLGEEIMD